MVTLATILIALGVLSMALITRSMITELHSLREAEFRPFLTMDFVVTYGKPWIHLVVKNLGKEMATNVRLELQPELLDWKGRSLQDSSELQKALRFMPPGREVRFFVGVADEYFGQQKPMAFHADIRYANPGGSRQFHEEAELDLSNYEEFATLTTKDMNELASRLDDLGKSLGRIALNTAMTREAVESQIAPPQSPVLPAPEETTTKKASKSSTDIPTT
ncbi:MAG: hypothetical protein C4521_10315 [Actinobacteria bacterium]|nr:MAG: hypothetical protein C4521_10315 [Actinomycetota bacterium]